MFFKNIFSCKTHKNYEDSLSLLAKKIDLDYNKTKVQNEKQKQKNLQLEEELYRTQIELNRLEIKENNKSVLEKIKEYFWKHLISSLIVTSIISGGAILFFYYFNYTPNYFPNIADLGTLLSWITILVALFAFVFNFSFYIIHLMEKELSSVRSKQLLLFFIAPLLINISSFLVDYNYKFNYSSYFIVAICYFIVPFICGILFIEENKFKNSFIYMLYIFIVTVWFYLVVIQYVIHYTNFTDVKIVLAISFSIYIFWLWMVYLYIKELSQGKQRILDYTILMTIFTGVLFGTLIIITVMRTLNIGYYSIAELEIKYINYNTIHKYIQNNSDKCKQGEPINSTIYELIKDNRSIILNNVNVLSSIGDEYYIQKTCKDKNSTENGFIIKKSDVINRGDIGVFHNKKKNK